MSDEAEHYDSLVTNQIDNIIMFKNFIDSVIEDCKSGEYKMNLIKKLSSISEKFFNEMENQYTPREKIVDILSDISSSDKESDSDDEFNKKINFYKYKMEKFMASSQSIDDSDKTESSAATPCNTPNDYSYIDNYKPVSITTGEYQTEQKPKSKDKLAYEFLNNNLELKNYHYLKSFNLNRVNSWINSSFIY